MPVSRDSETSYPATENVGVTGAAGKYVRIWELLIAPTASTTLDISSPAATSLTGTMTMTGLYQGRSIAPHWVGAVSQDVVITVGANGAGQVVWSLEG